MTLSEHQEAVSGALPIVARGASWVVVDKPSGLLSVPGRGVEKSDCAAVRVRAMFPHAVGPLVVHRLDMDTSGLLLFGLTPATQRALSMQFEARTVGKRYIALVDGDIQDDACGAWRTISFPIRVDLDNRPYQIHDAVHGKSAETRWRVVTHERFLDRRVTRLEFEPLTGRSHQLRVHAAHRLGLHMPILGDALYGDQDSAPRLFLHATQLDFDDPDTARRIHIKQTPAF